MSENDALKTSENPLHKSNKNIPKIDNINFFKILEINQRLTTK